jgi:predicted metal-dependent hydrolase
LVISNQIEVDGKLFYYEIQKKKRKRLTILVKPGPKIHVRVPIRTTNKEVQNFVKMNVPWITKQIKRLSEITMEQTLRWDNKDNIQYLGETTLIKLFYNKEISKQGTKVFHTNFNNKREIVIEVNPNHFPSEILLHTYLLKKLNKFFKIELKTHINKKIGYYSNNGLTKPSSFEIRYYKKRLGAAYKDGKVKFNMKLIHAKPEIIDAIIVHELVHLDIFNHSKQFWDKVNYYYPNYVQAKKYLEQHIVFYELKNQVQ